MKRLCPKCNGVLEEIKYPSDSYLNRDQWEGVRKGDYYCDACHSRYCGSLDGYFWRNEVKIHKRLRCKLFFAWYDIWVGLYIDKKNRALYFCPLPALVLKFWYEE